MSELIRLKEKLGTIGKIHQMTEAMQIIAVTQLKQVQSRQKAAQHYKKHYDRMARRLNIRLKRRSGRIEPKNLIYVFGSDRGFCGSFNEKLVARAAEVAKTQQAAGFDVDLAVLGRRGQSIAAEFDLPNLRPINPVNKVIDFGQISGMALEAYRAYFQGRVNQVYLLYNEFKTMLFQSPSLVSLLPFDRPEAGTEDQMLIVEPSLSAVRQYVVLNYIKVLFYDAFLQTRLGEVGARLMTMRNATENSKELIKELRIKYNKARQSMITVELSEILSSFEILNEGAD
ncbi:MAG: F0F1 ATP synthase subunit gamma [Candidatus Margulisbacteria bacterium]|nr:F0F1 ATP synthase subunit gamma [Candidatus Margulisiibacteriota bacterium]